MHKISNRIFEIFFKKTLDFLLAGFFLISISADSYQIITISAFKKIFYLKKSLFTFVFFTIIIHLENRKRSLWYRKT